ncbi:hypothetical protein BTM25_40930 [Actinomadura rubteroloni]|uniref:DUF4326 domain-containing protein n=1 Tax=Actinomadura rubteroloni TaxID=1926885 RepID=A0A2P4UKA2_9ACTN|nr:DUF4326 domain-containing protein [Actinomadura rubteroloni]POM25446.1 hypothetical protein BTM25_40930 [Actinomadura rubteroloni]
MTGQRTPVRVRMTRAKPWRDDHPDAVIVARPTRWGNPFPVRDGDRAEAIRRFRIYLSERPELVTAARRELAGRDLAWWCPLDQPCHADVLLDVANRPAAPGEAS